jgi:hypothetical protein
MTKIKGESPISTITSNSIVRIQQLQSNCIKDILFKCKDASIELERL